MIKDITGLCNYPNLESTLYSLDECNSMNGTWTTFLELFEYDQSHIIINDDNSFIQTANPEHLL